MPSKKNKQKSQSNTENKKAKEANGGDTQDEVAIVQPSGASGDAALAATPKDEKTSKDYYFDSYSHFGIHEEMLKDQVRTRTYMNSIMGNKHLFQGKTVLDVGCGTGILSMFAAKAGAKKVIGVDCASIITQARLIVAANGLDGVVTLIQAKIEDADIGVDKVDIIISEWMGYFLLYESMLDTIIYARDKWLVPGGLMFPDKATLYVCGIEDADYREKKIEFWDNVYGFDMKCIKELAMAEPLVETCASKQVITDSQPVLEVDIRTCKKEDLDFSSPFKLKFRQNDYCHALVAYFSVDFSASHRPCHFSTGPHDRYTHWKQVIFYLDNTILAYANDTMEGVISVKRNAKNPRDIDIKFDTLNINGAGKTTNSRNYRLR